MKITDVQTLRLRAPIPAEGQVFSRSGVRSTRSTALLRVETDEGIWGIGSASGNGELIETDKVQQTKNIGGGGSRGRRFFRRGDRILL